jgi:rhomboid-like protein
MPHLAYENLLHNTIFLRFTSPVCIFPHRVAVTRPNSIRSAGLFSSLASHVVTARLVYPRLVSKLAQPGESGSPGMIRRISSSLSSFSRTNARSTTDAAAATPTILPSLGASGAIYGTVIISALAFPQAEVSLVFPPTPPFPIQYGVGGLVLLDCIGVLRGWRYGCLSWLTTDCADD